MEVVYFEKNANFHSIFLDVVHNLFFYPLWDEYI